MAFNRLVKFLATDDPAERFREADTQRLILAFSIGIFALSASLTALVALTIGPEARNFPSLALTAAVFLAITVLLRAGAPARLCAGLIVLACIAITGFVVLRPFGGIASELLSFYIVLIIFTGVTIGRRAMVALGGFTMVAVALLVYHDVTVTPSAGWHDAPAKLIVGGVWQVAMVVIVIAMALGALRAYRVAMDELRAARDEARRASAAKSAFLANTSHEIRTPLNGVLGMAQMLETTDLTPDQRRYLETIKESGRTLLAMLNDVLDLSKVEAGRLDVTRAPSDLRSLLSATVEAWRPEAARKGLSLTLRIAADLPPMLELDRIRVRQCVENLISNAVKFTERGEIRVAAQGRGTGARYELIVEVADTGIGVEADQIQRIFDPFHQTADAERTGAGGTGLGLAIVRNLARLMGGDLTCASERGRGAAFALRIAAPVSEAPRAQTAAAPVARIAPLEEPRARAQ